MRSRETERRVAELAKENQLYRAQYEELRREFDVLKSLLLKTGLTEQVIEDEAQRHISTTSNTNSSVAAAAAAAMQQQFNRVVVNSTNHDHHHMVNHHSSNQSDHQTVTQVPYGTTSLDGTEQWADSINPYMMEHF